MEDSNLTSLLPQQQRVLVAPLDWGIGHATRCVPIIDNLLRQENEVILAADGSAFEVLARLYPQLPLLRLPGKAIRYSKNPNWLWWVLLKQLPSFLFSIFQEHKAVEKIRVAEKIDVIISDNRYGLFSKKCKSIFITHQLQLPLPWAWQWMTPFTNGFIHWCMKQYDSCWIPDFEGEKSLSGALSQKRKTPKNTRFIGPLSRMKTAEQNENLHKKMSFVLSGPEPQRSLLEQAIIQQIKLNKEAEHLKFLLVRGKAHAEKILGEIPSNLEIIDFADSEEMASIYMNCDCLVVRSGYSTIMDLEVLGCKHAVFIPTPGQVEQEYLAKHLQLTKGYPFISQAAFRLQDFL